MRVHRTGFSRHNNRDHCEYVRMLNDIESNTILFIREKVEYASLPTDNPGI